MEEAEDELGLGFSPGFKFRPDDDELVEYYLLRRILDQQLPLEVVIFEDDPLSAPPWELLDRYKRKNEAFFFANGQTADNNGKGSRQKRTCVGGGWQGQKVCVDGKRLRVPDSGNGGMEIAWRKYMLNFHPDGGVRSMGWVMHEYSITAPCDLASSSLRLYHIRFSGHGKGSKREPDNYVCVDGGAPQARAAPDLHEQQLPAAANYVFPTVAAVDLVDHEDGGSAWPPAATPISELDYYQWVNGTYQLESFQDLVVPHCADVGDYAGPGAASSHQDFLDGNTMNHGATPSSDQGGAPGVMNQYDGAAPAAGMLPFGQGSFSGAIDESFMDFELSDLEFNTSEYLVDPGSPLACAWQAPLHDRYSSVGMQTQSSMHDR